MIRHLRNAFFTGLFFMLPLSITIIIIKFMIEKVGKPLSNLFFYFVDYELRSFLIFDLLLNSLSFFFLIILIIFLGLLSNYFLTKMMIKTTENIIYNLPFINIIYNTTKKVVQSFNKKNNKVFKSVVLVEYPKKGVYGIGFLTGSTIVYRLKKVTYQNMSYVFIPTTPNPTSGYLILVPSKKLILTNIDIMNAIKLIVSGGTINKSFSKILEKTKL
jgi:uncharacterized membrane protein